MMKNNFLFRAIRERGRKKFPISTFSFISHHHHRRCSLRKFIANTFVFSRAHFYYGSKRNDLSFSLGHFSRAGALLELPNNQRMCVCVCEEKPLFRNGLDASSCGEFDKKPFLIRFRNRRVYPLFVLFSLLLLFIIEKRRW